MATPVTLLRKGRRVRIVCKRCAEHTDAPVGTAREELNLCRKCYGKGRDKRPRELNDLTGHEWAAASRSVQEYPDTRTPKQRLHGACFPQSLAEQHIRMYTKRGQAVLDPFLGVGTTLDAALALGRKCIGIELNGRFARIARLDAVHRFANAGGHIRIIVDDARNLRSHVTPESVDLVLTSPPYSTLLKSSKAQFAYKWREHSKILPISVPAPYSTRKGDLGNMGYPEYLSAIQEVLRGCWSALKPQAYAVWVVRDFRNLKQGIPYVNLHGDLINCAQSVGFRLWDIRIYDQTRFRPLVCLGFPSRNFYLNISHSYILVFRKS